MYGYWFGMNFFWWVFWVALIVAFFAFLTPVPRRRTRPLDDPLEILKRRYAAGEITSAEYDERRARLLGDRLGRDPARPPPPPPAGTRPAERTAEPRDLTQH